MSSAEPGAEPTTEQQSAAQQAADQQAAAQERSRLHRQRQNLRNLVAALGVCILLVVVIILVVPRNDSPRVFDVDYAQVAAEAQPQYEEQLVAPKVPEGWTANQAEIRTSADGVSEWYVGFIANENDKPVGYVGLSQGINANETWVYEKLDRRPVTGTIELGGLQWQEYDHTDLNPDDAGNTRYSLVTTVGDSTFVVYGSNTPEQVQTVATAIANAL